MTSILETKQQLSNARQSAQKQREQVRIQRELISKKEREIKQAKTTIDEQIKKIPPKTQLRLRSGLYAGLEGRRRRQVIYNHKQQLEQQKKKVGNLKLGLTKYEKEISGR